MYYFRHSCHMLRARDELVTGQSERGEAVTFLDMRARLVRSERGASVTEYALIVVMIALSAGVAAAIFGGVLSDYIGGLTLIGGP